MNLSEFMQKYIKKVDEKGIEFINTLNLSEKLQNSIMYSYTAGGKRIRPLLLLATIDAFKGNPDDGINTACALELIHTSSLIHDDLPAMDNDDYRRGKLTNHKVFGDATAILAGDALLVNSFNMICLDKLLTDDKKIKLINELALCAGANGMIGGQEFDIENENKQLDILSLKHIHEHKTGKLLQFPMVAGAIIASRNDLEIDSVRKCAGHIGVAFQIKDDILDVVGTAEELGKPVNSDEKNHKCTYVSLLGLKKAQEELYFHYNEALSILDGMNIEAHILKELFKLIIERNK